MSAKSSAKSVEARLLYAAAWLLGLLTLAAWNLRLRAAWTRLLKVLSALPLRLRPGLYDQQDAYKRQFTGGPVRSRRLRERFCRLAQECEQTGASPDSLLDCLGLSPEQTATLTPDLVAAAFAGVPPEVREAAVQYSGGADSTLAALIAGLRFDRVHLLTFHHPFIRERDRAALNARKLANLLGPDAVVHEYLDSTPYLRALMFGDYWRDLRRYGTAPVADPCLACKLSFDAAGIEYACRHGLRLVVDGADLRVPFQLSQGHEGILEMRRQFYLEYGVDFRHPVISFEETTAELLLYGLRCDPPRLLYPHQPDCAGNDLLGAVFKRFYFLPRYGLEGLEAFGERWTAEKLDLLRRMLPARSATVSLADPPISA